MAAWAMARAPSRFAWPPMKPPAWQNLQSTMPDAAESAASRRPRQASGRERRFVNAVPSTVTAWTRHMPEPSSYNTNLIRGITPCSRSSSYKWPFQGMPPDSKQTTWAVEGDTDWRCSSAFSTRSRAGSQPSTMAASCSLNSPPVIAEASSKRASSSAASTFCSFHRGLRRATRLERDVPSRYLMTSAISMPLSTASTPSIMSP
mmetsp:Transcript_32785/g.110463  ORF Transcript_32785/g.110463 Transcript_32785/m.110463 type:complete len:204 (-) Transcript_32785:572-1183(-)